MPFEPHALTTHWVAAVHASPVASAQVFVVGLHAPLAHTACAAEAVQTPVRTPSVGIASPATSFGLHAWAARSQRSPEAQSLSIQQPPFDMQVPAVGEHAPDWQTAAPVASTQPLWPFA